MEVRVVVPPAAQDAVSSVFFDHGSLGLTEEEGSDPARGPYVLLRGYFEKKTFAEDRDSFEADLKAMLEKSGSGSPRVWIEELPYGDWAEGWKKYFKPRRVGKSLVVAPTWEEFEPAPGDVVLRVDPGMAFGTGQHETTSLCLAALEEHAARFAGARVLDVGTGSGILAIGAVKLGASSAIGIDVDPEAVTAARENVEANGLDGRIEISATPLEKVPGTFPVVVANILAEALIAMAEPLGARVAPGGMIVLSGILHHLGPEVWRAFLARGFERIDEKRDGEWVCLLAEAGSRSGST
jgi:ribosomal protein L11 methyltransferase